MKQVVVEESSDLERTISHDIQAKEEEEEQQYSPI